MTGNNKYAHIGFFEVTNPTPLPVELLYFEAEVLQGGVMLKWATASETNSDYYSLFRSIDAYSWEQIAEIPAAGNSNMLLEYKYFDPSLFYDISYYRLKQTDFDGTIAHSWYPISVFRKPEGPLSIIITVDLLGREVSDDYKGLVIEYYSDGTSRKLFKQ